MRGRGRGDLPLCHDYMLCCLVFVPCAENCDICDVRGEWALQAAEAAKRDLERRVSELEKDLSARQKLQHDLEGVEC